MRSSNPKPVLLVTQIQIRANIKMVVSNENGSGPIPKAGSGLEGDELPGSNTVVRTPGLAYLSLPQSTTRTIPMDVLQYQQLTKGVKLSVNFIMFH
jgi:hypothetical protein